MAYSSVHTHTHARTTELTVLLVSSILMFSPSFLNCNKAQGGWGSRLPFSFAVIPILPFPVLCHSGGPARCTSSQGLVADLGKVLWLPQGSSRSLEPCFDRTLGSLLEYQGSGHLEPLSSPSAPFASPLPSRCWGKQDNSNVAVTGKQPCQQQLSQDASVIEKAIEGNSALPSHRGSAVLKIHIFLLFESILCKASCCHSQQSPVQSHRSVGKREWARDLTETASRVCLFSLFAGRERSCEEISVAHGQ